MKIALLHSFLLILLASACNRILDNSEPVVKVGERTLTLEELSANVPDYLDATDSALWADDYIKKWVQLELLLQKATQNLSAEMKDVSKELEEYRNSLLIYRYKNEVMKQKLDTSVRESAVSSYFREHRESFILNKNIVRAVYIKVPIAVSAPSFLKELCVASDPESLRKLNEYGVTYAKAYDRFNDKWVSADLVIKNTPAEIENQEKFLENNAFIEKKDKEFYYLVYIRDYRLSGEVAPIEYVEESIRNLILTKQKLEFFQQLEKDIYKEGIDKNKVKLFKIKNSTL